MELFFQEDINPSTSYFIVILLLFHECMDISKNKLSELSFIDEFGGVSVPVVLFNLAWITLRIKFFIRKQYL